MGIIGGCLQVKTESTAKLSNFNFYWTKILYQDNLKILPSFLHFSRAKDVITICSDTEKNFSWKSEKMNVKFHKNCDYTGKILKISCVRCNFVKI